MASVLPPEEREQLAFLDQVDGEIKGWRETIGFERDATTWARLRAGTTRGRGAEPIFGANLAGSLFERKVAALTESQPDIRVSARNPTYSGAAKVLTKTCQAIFAQNAFDSRVETAADFAGTFGFVGWNTAWDPTADFGDGDIVVRPLDPRRVAVDHRVTDPTEIDRWAQYARIDQPMPLDTIRQIWPGRGADVTAEADVSQSQSAQRSGWLERVVRRPLRAQPSATGPYEWATVREYWVRSSQRHDDGTFLFPAGRVIHRAGDVVLDDKPNPYWDGGWGIDLWDWRVNFDSHMGRSDMEEVRKLQEGFTRVNDAVLKNIILSCAVTIIGDYNALQPGEWDKITNEAARILKTNPGRRLEFIPPTPIPAQYLEFARMLAALMETQLGVPAVMQGNRQPGVIATSAVEGLMTAAQTLIRAAARRLEYVIERIGVKLVSRILQFYTSDRVMLLQGPGSNWQEYTFRRAELLADTLPPDAVDREGTPLTLEQFQRRFFTNFRFKVTPLSSLAQNRIQRALMAMNLYKAGLVKGDEVLRAAEWPDWEKAYVDAQQAISTGQQPPPDMGNGGGGRSNRRGTKLTMGA